MLANSNIDHLVIDMAQQQDLCKGYLPLSHPLAHHRNRYCTLEELSNVAKMPINSVDQLKVAVTKVKTHTIVTQAVDPNLRIIVNMANYARSEMPIPFVIFDSEQFPAMLVGPMTTVVKGLGVETHYIHPTRSISGVALLLSFVAQQEGLYGNEPYFALQCDSNGVTLGQYRGYSNETTSVLSRYKLFPSHQLEQAVKEKQNVWLLDEVNLTVTHVAGNKRYTLL